MMAQVILLQPKPNSILHGEMVRRIVNRVVANVTDIEARRNRRCKTPEGGLGIQNRTTRPGDANNRLRPRLASLDSSRVGYS